MEFLSANLINTTTQIAVASNTSTVSNIFNRDSYFQYYTDGMNSDLTTTSITITFDSTTTISRLALIDINLKEFSIFYNGATANSISLTTTGSTVTSSFTGNAENKMYLRFSSLAVSSITIDMKKTITANEEKRVGLLYIGDLYLSMERVPEAAGYKPRKNPKQVVHALSDGGTRIHNIRRKWSIDINLDYVGSTLRDDLEEIYELREPFQFCPWGTMTSWDGIFFEAVWPGTFDFYEYSDNASVSGYSGKISLRETPT